MTDLAPGFIRLRDIAPSIIEDIRYSADNNFVGSRIDGYNANCAIMTEQAASNLKLAQEEFTRLGYSLVIYEAYRPQKATDHFVRWAQDIEDNKMMRLYYPRVTKPELFSGYISSKSAHTRGAAVDVSLIQAGTKLYSCKPKEFLLNDGVKLKSLDDGTVDMGGHFDLLDEASWHNSNLVAIEQLTMRNLLRSVMERSGFKMYHKEWWHYSLADEPYPDTYFDFDVC